MARKIRVVIAFVLFALSGGALYSKPDHMTVYRYYTDATLTTQCGYRNELCTGTYWGGCQTEFYEWWESSESCDSPCGGDGCGVDPCSDGIDNDHDGYTDTADSDCDIF
jgi:hypothetical protein